MASDTSNSVGRTEPKKTTNANNCKQLLLSNECHHLVSLFSTIRLYIATDSCYLAIGQETQNPTLQWLFRGVIASRKKQITSRESTRTSVRTWVWGKINELVSITIKTELKVQKETSLQYSMDGQLPQKVGCLPCAVGKQPSIPRIIHGRKWTLRRWWCECKYASLKKAKAQVDRFRMITDIYASRKHGIILITCLSFKISVFLEMNDYISNLAITFFLDMLDHQHHLARTCNNRHNSTRRFFFFHLLAPLKTVIYPSTNSVPIVLFFLSFLNIRLRDINPLRTIGSPVNHENWPMNWPNFAASPALLGWPARNRHTAACIHRFFHIFRRPPVPVVWFMSESRAVANEHEGYKRTIPIISSSFWMTVVLKGLMYSFSPPACKLAETMSHHYHNTFQPMVDVSRWFVRFLQTAR